MTIIMTITQGCDGCGQTRQLDNVSQFMVSGWRELGRNHHICPDCITVIVDTMPFRQDQPEVE